VKLEKTFPWERWGITVLRIATGTVFFLGGLHKLSVSGLAGATEQLGQLGSPLPSTVAVAISLVELGCDLDLVVGLFTRWVAIPLALGMLIDVMFVHWPGSLYVDTHGVELALLRLGASVALVLAGPGKAALDNALSPRKKRKFYN
jgi:putative oxidoreductase